MGTGEAQQRATRGDNSETSCRQFRRVSRDCPRRLDLDLPRKVSQQGFDHAFFVYAKPAS
jgi:hypothetical protein